MGGLAPQNGLPHQGGLAFVPSPYLVSLPRNEVWLPSKGFINLLFQATPLLSPHEEAQS